MSYVIYDTSKHFISKFTFTNVFPCVDNDYQTQLFQTKLLSISKMCELWLL